MNNNITDTILPLQNRLRINTTVESQKGINASQWFSIENQKGTIAIDSVQR